jgi:hypothetical protein
MSTLDFGSLTVFYRYEQAEPADMREDGYSRGSPPVPARAELVKITCGETDITADCADLFGDDWSNIETRLVEKHEDYLEDDE